jgi:hypothetical protein
LLVWSLPFPIILITKPFSLSPNAKFNLPALSGVDTRALTKIIAANGTTLARKLIPTATLFPQQSKISGKFDLKIV